MYDVTTYGAIGDGNVANAALNTTAFLKAISQAIQSPEVIHVPMGNFVVNNGQLKLTGQNMVFEGEGGMGSGQGDEYGATTITGVGPGHTIESTNAGNTIRNLAFRANKYGDQVNTDAFINVSGTPSQFTLSKVHMFNANIGFRIDAPVVNEGEYWIEDVLIEGHVKLAGFMLSAGNSAITIRHVVMYAIDPQPSYGIAVTACGELVMSGGCDIICMGSCLALVPGLGGVQNQYVMAVFISDCLFDSGNGLGCVYVCPTTNGFVGMVRFANVWASTANNGKRTWPTNGFTFDGTQTKPPVGVKAIQDVSLTNCVAQYFLGHCGVYAKSVDGLTITNSTFGGGLYQGIQLSGGCAGAILQHNKLGDFRPAPVGGGIAGCERFGIYIEAGCVALEGNNVYRGNLAGALWVEPGARVVIANSLVM